jgi:hypothetical protein
LSKAIIFDYINTYKLRRHEIKMSKSYKNKRVQKVDAVRVKHHDLTPYQLEIQLVNDPHSHSIEVCLTVKETYSFPGLVDKKPLVFSRRVNTLLCSESADFRNERDYKRVGQKMRKCYEIAAELIQKGQYTLHTYTDGRLEVKLEPKLRK